MAGVKFDPILGELRTSDVGQVSAPSTLANTDLEVIADGSANGIIYFWVNGHRFKITGVLDDPVVSTIVGANAALSLLGP